MARAAQMEQGGPSQPVEEEVEEGDEASSMDISESMEMPPPPVRTPRPRGRGRQHRRMAIDELANNMGTLNIEQRETLNLVQANDLLQAIQEEERQRWDGWFQHYPPPQ